MSDKEKPQPGPEEDPLGSFFIKIPQTPQVHSAEAEKNEKELLARFKQYGPRAETLKPLAIFYSRVGQPQQAYHYLKLWMRSTQNDEEVAESLLMCGQLAEQVNQLGSAGAFYREGIKRNPTAKHVSYWLYNNLAYCLNQDEKFEEANRYARAAIAIDESRSNAYKNLGISFAGQGKFGEAAEYWIQALHVDASDSRPLELLDQLLADHRPEIETRIPDLMEKLEACRRAAAMAKTGRFADWARGLTLN